MKGAEINLEVPELRQGRVSEPQLGEGTFFTASVRGFKRLNDTITVGESLL